MSNINDGGPAFPVPGHIHDEDFEGMRLRDYFAAKAIQGLLARPGGFDPKQDSEFAYMVADAMLKAREAMQ